MDRRRGEGALAGGQAKVICSKLPFAEVLFAATLQSFHLPSMSGDLTHSLNLHQSAPSQFPLSSKIDTSNRLCSTKLFWPLKATEQTSLSFKQSKHHKFRPNFWEGKQVKGCRQIITPDGQ